MLPNNGSGGYAYTPCPGGGASVAASTGTCANRGDGRQYGGMYPTAVWNCLTNSRVGAVNPYALDAHGGLDINLTLTGCMWNSGVMQTVGADARGFAQQYGYFEMMAELPASFGVWPGFWLLPQNPANGRGEIDVMENYGFANAYCMTLHDWNNNANSAGSCPNPLPNGINLQTGYHIYGMLWTASQMTFYIDGIQLWQHATLGVMNTPYYLLVDLGVGGPGWSSLSTTSPQTMRVKYIRAYQPP
jgi:hypothetical protein